ncbi:hypothetical protein [Agromyces marinus]|uniref:Lactococcin 972 family bacteriocin n=1 Tax=Agromyces marinus TaxID=1389020 RepID=A0ABM8H1R4_9MICO|nr:hypothetical protein [Agromyces marinus]UIP57198.1 hypothetical protein DSM26151_00530 [Agromyces marinus]BDZ54716.1 hypothetical protein GCM10025870_17890 [Agromyces marinus]
MSAKRKLALAGAGMVSAVALVMGSALPAFAGEWIYGSKNCIGSGSGYVYTHSGGSGTITHGHKHNNAWQTYAFLNGSSVRTNHKTFWTATTQAASVAGPSANWGSNNCSSS